MARGVLVQRIGLLGGDGTVTGTPTLTADTLLLHCNGSDGATTLTDDGPLGLSPSIVGGELDTAQMKFGSASYLNTGSGEHILVAASGDRWQLTSDSSFELFVRLNSLPSVRGDNFTIISTRPVGSSRGFVLIFNSNANGLQAVGWNSSGSLTFNTGEGSTGVTTGVWYHVGIRRNSSGAISVWQDGVMEASEVSVTAGEPSAGDDLQVCGRDKTNSSRWFDGWCDEVAVNKGAARDLSIVPTTEMIAA